MSRGMGAQTCDLKGGSSWTYPSPPHRRWYTKGYGRQAGGTHPTGMLSCVSLLYLLPVQVSRIAYSRQNQLDKSK